MKKIKLVLSIRSLDIGGAERQFIELVKNIDKKKFNVTVVTMYGGIQEKSIKDIKGVAYHNLNKKSRYDIFGFCNRYKKVLYTIKPDVIYSFMGEMNIFSYICKPKRSKLIWGFRASNMDLKQYGRVSQIIFLLQKLLSKNIDCIISNSKASISFHQQNGFYMNNSLVIYNGIDTEKFRFDNKKRLDFRKKFNIDSNKIVFGIAARIDAMKGYPVLAKTLYDLFESGIEFMVCIAGSGDENIKREFINTLQKYKDKVIFLGSIEDMPYFYSGVDIVISSSVFGEGFSNSIAEAMSCQRACVVTDVGDSAFIVQKSGIVVEPNDSKSLKDGLLKILDSNYIDLGKKARERIVKNFSIKHMVKHTQEVIEKCAE